MDAQDAAKVFAEGADVLQGRRTLKEARGISDEALESIYGIVHEMYNGGRHSEALKGFELLCLYDHENPKYWKGLGYCRQMLEDYMGAATALSYSTQYLDQHDWDLYYNLARCLMVARQKGLANEYVDAILESDAASELKDRARSLQSQLNYSDNESEEQQEEEQEYGKR